MDEDFDLPVTYKGKQLLLRSSLLITGYTHKFIVEVNGQIILFEPDEERNYRAVIDAENFEEGKKIDRELLKNIAEAIRQLLQ